MSDNNVTRPPARSGGLPARSQASPESREQPQEQPQPAHQQRHQQQQQQQPSWTSMDRSQAPSSVQMLGDNMLPGIGATDTLYALTKSHLFPDGIGRTQMGTANLSATA
eukprot:scpid110458/ scgid16729/ 